MTLYFIIPGLITAACALVYAFTPARFAKLANLAFGAYCFSGLVFVFFLVEPLTKPLFMSSP